MTIEKRIKKERKMALKDYEGIKKKKREGREGQNCERMKGIKIDKV